MEAMTQEQRQKTKEALSRYGQKNWVYGPCNWGWKRAIQLAEEYYREADPGLRGSILQLRYMERREAGRGDGQAEHQLQHLTESPRRPVEHHRGLCAHYGEL